MRIKYCQGDFGTCPLASCSASASSASHLLPAGTTSLAGVDTLKLFCPRCSNLYHPPAAPSGKGAGRDVARLYAGADLDGAYWGPSFPGLFFMTFCGLVPGGGAERKRRRKGGSEPDSGGGGKRTRLSGEAEAAVGKVDQDEDEGESEPLNPNPYSHVPTIFGFRVHKSSPSLPRWIRRHRESRELKLVRESKEAGDTMRVTRQAEK